MTDKETKQMLETIIEKLDNLEYAVKHLEMYVFSTEINGVDVDFDDSTNPF